MYQKTKNKTAIKYREWIIKAFLELLKTYTFDEVTIKQITLQADVSRQTFYRHFSSKEDILEEISKKICTEISDRLNNLEHKTLYDVSFTYFTFWKENSFLLELVKKSKCEHLLTEYYYTIMLDSLNILQESMLQYNEEEFAMIKYFLLGGFYSMKFNWMEQHFQYSPEELAHLINSLIN